MSSYSSSDEGELSDIIQGIQKSVEQSRTKKPTKQNSRGKDKQQKPTSKPQEKTDMKYQMDLFGGVPDYYKVIGAKQSDPQKDIIRKCNEKVAEYHPDKQAAKLAKYPPEERKKKEALFENQFVLVREAVKFLKDPEKRKYYDLQKKSAETKSYFSHKQGFGDFMKSQESDMTDETKQLKEAGFKQKMIDLDKKHNFDSSKSYKKDDYKFATKDFSRRLDDLRLERDMQEAECAKKNMFEGRTFNNEEFQKKFEAQEKKRQRHHRSDDRSIVKLDGVAAANDYGGSGGNYMSLDEDGKGYEDLYTTSKDNDYLYAGRLDSEDDKSVSSLDDIDDIDVSYVDGHNKHKDKTEKSYADLLKERNRQDSVFDSRNIGDSSYGSVTANPFNPSAQMGEIFGTDMLDVKQIKRDKKMKQDVVNAYKSLTYNPSISDEEEEEDNH
jgi:DnaJ domain